MVVFFLNVIILILPTLWAGLLSLFEGLKAADNGQSRRLRRLSVSDWLTGEPPLHDGSLGPFGKMQTLSRRQATLAYGISWTRHIGLRLLGIFPKL